MRALIRQLARVALAALAAGHLAGAAGVPVPLAQGPITGPGADFFHTPAVHRFQLEIAPGDIARLRHDPREYVAGHCRVAGRIYSNVAVRVKGETTFRSIDEKPSFTLHFAKFARGQRFHGLRKVHLNNSLEDPCFLNENVGGALFRSADLPAPRVAYATVDLNGRLLGFFVLKEGFTEEFLGQWFERADGNLYDTETGHDVTDRMERDQGSGPADWSDLQALAGACQEPDPRRRWERMEAVLDVDRFARFMAMEVLLGHRDGYCLGRNNFRLYQNPASQRFVFLPHGMDQLFGNPHAGIFPTMAGVVAQAFWDTPAGRERYRTELALLVTNVFEVEAIQAFAAAQVSVFRSSLNRAEGAVFDREYPLWRGRVQARRAAVVEQLGRREVVPLDLGAGPVQLTNWIATDAPAGGALCEESAPDGTPALAIKAGPVTAAAWQSTVWLSPGEYRFEARVKTAGVEPLRFGTARGAGVRIVGQSRSPAQGVEGFCDWTPLSLTFQLGQTNAVSLLCELRAGAGTVWFDRSSLRLARLPGGGGR